MTKIASSTSAGARKRYGVVLNLRVIRHSRKGAGPFLWGKGTGRRRNGPGGWPAVDAVDGSESRDLLDELVGRRDRVGQGLLGGDLVEQRRLDRLEDDLVDVGLLRDRRDDVLVRRDDALRERPG